MGSTFNGLVGLIILVLDIWQAQQPEISRSRIDKKAATKPQGGITALKAVEGTNGQEINSMQHRANMAPTKL